MRGEEYEDRSHLPREVEYSGVEEGQVVVVGCVTGRQDVRDGKRGTASCIRHVLLPCGDAILCEGEGCHISNSIHIRVAGLQLAVYLRRACDFRTAEKTRST